MGKGLVVAAAFAFALSGCADYHVRMREQHGQLSIQKSAVPGADYIVSMQNVQDIGYDPDTKASRDEIVLHYVKAQCPRATIVGEDIIETGQFALGAKARTYQVRVKC